MVPLNKGLNFGNQGNEALDYKEPLSYPDLIRLSDEVLMAHLKAGHHDALAVLFDRYHRLVLKIALRILKDPAEAEDLMQAVFLEIFRCVAQFDPAKGTTKMWILQYAYHRSFNRRKRLALREVHEKPQESILAEATPSAYPATRFGKLESAQMIREALGRLKKAQRRTLELAFYEGYTIGEIAERTGATLNSVKHNYYRGLEKLRSILCDVYRTRPDTPSPEKVGVHVQPRTL